MDVRTLLREQVASAVNGGAWHGPALSEVLADVSPLEASTRPGAELHTIGEITFHVTGWIEEVAARLGGATPQLPAEGDWPATFGDGEDTWKGLLERLDRAQRTVLAAIDAFDPTRLDDTVGPAARNAPLGTGVSYAAMLCGLAQHTAYHTAQLVLIKRLVKDSGPPSP